MSRREPSRSPQGATILVSEILRENPKFSSKEVFAHLEAKGYQRQFIAEGFKTLEQMGIIRIEPTPRQQAKIFHDSAALRRRGRR